MDTGDDRTIKDLVKFLVRWMDRHPSYKGRPFFVTGESYAGARSYLHPWCPAMCTAAPTCTDTQLQPGQLRRSCAGVCSNSMLWPH